jgi:hypothetical protein
MLIVNDLTAKNKINEKAFLKITHHASPILLGRSPSGRAIRCNLFCLSGQKKFPLLSLTQARKISMCNNFKLMV